MGGQEMGKETPGETLEASLEQGPFSGLAIHPNPRFILLHS